MTTTTQSQNVVLQIPAKFQNKPGQLLLTTRKLIWKEDKKKEVAISAPLVDIQKLYVSKAEKLPLKLKFEYLEKKTNQLHVYLIELASENAKADVEKIKADWIKSKLPASLPAQNGKPAPNKQIKPRPAAASPAPSSSSPVPIRKPPTTDEINQRKNLLSRNGELAKLHQELVFGKKITEEDFWEHRQHLLRDQKAKDEQKKGRSSKLPDLQPVTEESGEVKIKITPQIISSIFEQYPSVAKAYDQNVPHKINEEEFWKRYYGSRFFHRNRNAVKNSTKDDIFDTCYQEEEEELINGPKRLKTDHPNPLVDLTLTAEDHLESGITPDITMRPGHGKTLTILRQFNRHGERVLQSINASSSSKLKAEGYMNEIIMEELDTPEQAERILLDIKDQTRYFQSHNNAGVGSEVDNEKNSTEVLSQMGSTIRNWNPNLKRLSLGKGVAVSVTSSLNKIIQEKNSRSVMIKNLDVKLPSSIEKEVLSAHASGKEFLRHFWATLGASAPEKREKNARMVEQIAKTLQKIESLGESAGDDEERVKSMLEPMRAALKHALLQQSTKRKR